jgi:hypothetical protein
LPLSADYSHMRCLYCGKEMALLKRLTGGGEFCSETHKQSYQEEYNRLALSRLLQAQSKPGDRGSAQNAPARPPEPVRVSSPVAVEEPAPVAEPVVVARHIEEPEVEDTYLPPGAGFSLEMPDLSSLAEGTPYVEPWMESRVVLATPKWLFQPALTFLPSAELLRLEVQPKAWHKAHSDDENGVTPQEFSNGKVDLSMPFALKSSHDIPTAGPVDLEFPPQAPEANRSLSLAGALGFQFKVVTQNPAFWERPQSVIGYSTEDADVLFPDLWDEFASNSPVDVPSQPEASEPEPDRTPRAALEALSRLHQNLVAEQTADESPAEAKSPAQTAVSPAEESETHEMVAVLVGAEDREIEARESAREQSIPRGSSDLLMISLKTFPPSESALAIRADALNTLRPPTLPRMKALPLRPKVAMAPPGFTPQPRTQSAKNPVTEAKLKSAGSIPIPPRSENRPKSATPPKPPVQQQKPAPAAQSPKFGPPVRATEPAATVQVQATAAKSPTTQAQAPVAKSTGTQASTPTAKSAGTQAPAPAAKSAGTQAPTSAAKSPAPQAPASAAKSPSTHEPIRVPPARTDKPQPRSKPDIQPSSTPDTPTSNFGTLHLQLMANNTSFIGSLKGKLAVAVALVILLGSAAYFMSGKSHKASIANSEQVDSAGPSIMMGEGGWVQAWGSDPLNAHVGRQITIYRPSLKLSDYRIEFQGQIETKSLGWVFRAADPNNYYAMKLAIVTPGASRGLALIKYVVRNGRETEAGRVSLNIPARNDTTYSIRTDVRGMKYSTYVQGQPVDVWTDDELKSGGVGFLNERLERARIKSVSIAYLTGGTK